jgi:hypothetical protein
MSLDDIQMLRVKDDGGAYLVAIAVSQGSRGLVQVGSQLEWEECEDVTSVLFDSTGLVQVTDPAVLYAVAAWVNSAAVWLSLQQSLERGDDTEVDDEFA